MYALRERRQHVTQEDFEFAIAKVCCSVSCIMVTILTINIWTGSQEEPRWQHICQQALLVMMVKAVATLAFFFGDQIH
jgi:hypothetical protein